MCTIGFLCVGTSGLSLQKKQQQLTTSSAAPWQLPLDSFLSPLHYHHTHRSGTETSWPSPLLLYTDANLHSHLLHLGPTAAPTSSSSSSAAPSGAPPGQLLSLPGWVENDSVLGVVLMGNILCQVHIYIHQLHILSSLSLTPHYTTLIDTCTHSSLHR
jgi:hypothetical protein